MVIALLNLDDVLLGLVVDVSYHDDILCVDLLPLVPALVSYACPRRYAPLHARVLAGTVHPTGPLRKS